MWRIDYEKCKTNRNRSWCKIMIYILWCIVSLLLFVVWSTYKWGKLTVEDLILGLLISAFSWLSVIALLIVVLITSDFKFLSKVIYKKKD